LIRIAKRPLFSNWQFSLLFLVIYLALPFVFSLETGGFHLRLIFFYPYLFLIITLSIFNIKSSKQNNSLSLSCEAISEKINTSQETLKKRKAIIDSYSNRLKRYSELKDFTANLTKATSLDEVANIILEETIRLLPQFSCCILYLINPKTYELNCFLSKGQALSRIKTKKGDIFDHWVVKKMKPLLVEDANKDFRFDLEQIERKGLRNFRSVIAVPLVTYNKIIGTLRIDSEAVKEFSQEDLRLLATVSDLAAAAIDNAILYKRTLDLAIRDGLTSLYLKKHFLERLEEELQRSSIKKNPLSLLMLDIDKFKDFNDRFGHIAGDIVLKSVSKILRDFAAGEGNIICRFGGEEFIILFSEMNRKQVIKLAEDLRKKIKSKEIILRRKSKRITVSIGVVSCPEDGFETQDLLRKVDSLMYKAKESGRDKVCFFGK